MKTEKEIRERIVKLTDLMATGKHRAWHFDFKIERDALLWVLADSFDGSQLHLEDRIEVK